MEKDSRIYIAGHTGLVGRSLEKRLRELGYQKLLTKKHQELDLRDQRLTEEFFWEERPEYVFFAAGKIGGVTANMAYPAEFIYDNLQMQTNVIHSSWANHVKKLMYFGSCCAYPTGIKEPIKEENLFTGKLEPTNESFAVAKLAGISMAQAHNAQYGSNFISVMPANLYGPGDNFHPENSHVVGMTIRKMHEAKINREKSVIFGGTGAPIRDWLYVEDLTDACLFLMQNYNSSELINIGTGKGVSKKQIVYVIKEIVGFTGDIIFDFSKPDGMMKRVLDVEKINSLGWQATTSLEEGLRKTYVWFLENKI